MDPVTEEEDEYRSTSEDSDGETLRWSLSSSLQQDSVLSASKQHVGHSMSQSVGVSASYRKQVSFAESTPLVGKETSTVVLSVDQDQSKTTAGVFVKERPLRVITKERKSSFFDRFSVSVQNMGETTLSMVQQRVETFHSISLPNIPSDDRKASSTLTVFNLLGMSFGISTLAFPFITARTGFLGISSVILLGILSLYTAMILVDCQYEISKSKPASGKKRVYRNFIDVGNAALPGKYSGVIMKALVSSSLLSDVYVFILLGQSTHQLAKATLPNMSYQVWILFWLAALIPTFSITRVSILAWISFASLIAFVIVVLLVYASFFASVSTWNGQIFLRSPTASTFFVGYGIILNSYNLHWYVPAIEASMVRPETFPQTCTVSIAINTFMKTSFAVLGAVTFGAATKQSVIENLGVSGSTLLTVIIVVLLFAEYFYFPMGLYVVFEMFDLYFLPYFHALQGEGLKRVIWLILSRGLVLLSVVFLAVSFSQFGFVVGAIGSLRGTIVAVVFPCLAHLKLKWKRLSLASKVLEIGLVLIFTLFGITGTYFSIRGMTGGVA